MNNSNGSDLYIGTAAWTIPPAAKELFEGEGTHLTRYAQQLSGVEINTSFYRDHKPSTYSKWAASVPPHFRFSVKLSKELTHEKRLQVEESELKLLLDGILHLDDKLGPLLIQLPPSLSYNERTAHDFFAKLRRHYSLPVVIEPRHQTWTSKSAALTLRDYGIGKVKADPEPCPTDDSFQLAGDCLYLRWHGSPEIYVSRYGEDELKALKRDVDELTSQKKFSSVWIIFDNTTYGFATLNALSFQQCTGRQRFRDFSFQFRSGNLSNLKASLAPYSLR